ncbi:hypothetical protein [Vibrio owensii]
MSYINYVKIMICLDILEEELNKIAKIAGHETFDEFCAKKTIGV